MTVLIVQAEQFLPLNHLSDLHKECTGEQELLVAQVIKQFEGTIVFLIAIGRSMDRRRACRAPPYFKLDRGKLEVVPWPLANNLPSAHGARPETNLHLSTAKVTSKGLYL